MKKRQLLRIKSANFPDNFGTLALSQGTIQIGRQFMNHDQRLHYYPKSKSPFTRATRKARKSLPFTV